MAHLKHLFASAAIAAALSALLASRSDWPVVLAAGALGAIAVSVIFLLVLAAVKLTNFGQRNSYEDPTADDDVRRLTGFDSEGNLMIHSWLRRGGK